MAVQLDFRLSPSWVSRTQEIDLATADEHFLRYDAFLGDLVFRIDGVDFSTDWEWVPTLDCARGLESVIGELEHGSRSVFEFTESDHAIRFVKEGDLVSVSATYRKDKARLPFEEFRSAVSAFSRRVHDQLCQQWPELKRNETIARWYATRPTE